MLLVHVDLGRNIRGVVGNLRLELHYVHYLEDVQVICEMLLIMCNFPTDVTCFHSFSNKLTWYNLQGWVF
jgi:hypothetical protein